MCPWHCYLCPIIFKSLGLILCVRCLNRKTTVGIEREWVFSDHVGKQILIQRKKILIYLSLSKFKHIQVFMAECLKTLSFLFVVHLTSKEVSIFKKPPRGKRRRARGNTTPGIDRPWRPLTSMATALPKHPLQIIHRRKPIANTSIDDMRKFYGEILCFDYWFGTASCWQQYSTDRRPPPKLTPRFRSTHCRQEGSVVSRWGIAFDHFFRHCTSIFCPDPSISWRRCYYTSQHRCCSCSHPPIASRGAMINRVIGTSFEHMKGEHVW